MRALGAVYGPYTGTCFSSTAETDIEHIVAASEAHDSGLFARDAATKARFARDLRSRSARMTFFALNVILRTNLPMTPERKVRSSP